MFGPHNKKEPPLSLSLTTIEVRESRLINGADNNAIDELGAIIKCCSKSLMVIKITQTDVDFSPNSRLLAGLCACQGLQQLKVSHNRISDEGALQLAGALSAWPHLLELDVRNNGFRKDAVSKAIVMSASLLPFLHTVMSDGFTSAGAQQLSQDIHKMTALQVLGIRGHIELNSMQNLVMQLHHCLLYTSPSPRD